MDDYSYLFGAGSDSRLDERKEVKVRLPIEHLIKLHGIKLVHGKTITETVVAALDRYFARVEREDRAASAARTTDEGHE